MPLILGWPSLVTVVAAILSLILHIRSSKEWSKRSRGKLLPPGPKPLPVIGNLLDMPRVKSWYGFRDMARKYGDVFCIEVFSQHLIILNSPEVNAQFMDKKTANSSDRMITPVIRLTSNEWLLGVKPYGEQWRNYRRAFWQHFHPGVIDKYKPVQAIAARRFLLKLLQKPVDFMQHIQFVFSTVLLKIGYGIDVEDENHELILAIDESLAGVAQTFVPNKFLVDAFPMLEHVPSWFPGGGFKKSFAKWSAASKKMQELPFSLRNTAFTQNTIPFSPPIVDILLQRYAKQKGDTMADATVEKMVREVTGVAFQAGADTAFATVAATFLAMSLYPDVQKRAHAELDATIGHSRLPDFSDRESLVYVEAIVKESLRWHNVTPLGISHRTLEDDEIGGYFIPGGSVLVSNIWAFMHDPKAYPDPDEFRPERFIRDGKIDPEVRDPSAFVFGSGRRICPGRYFADTGLFINIASFLHVFDIGQPLDNAGNPIRIPHSMTDGFLSHLEDCRCTIKPRGDWAKSLILESQNVDIET